MQLTLSAIAKALGGKVHGKQVLAPGPPPHSPDDRSMSVTISKSGDDIVVHSHAGDDDLVCKDYARAKLGLPAFQPKQSKQRGNGAAPRRSLDDEIGGWLKPKSGTSVPNSMPTKPKLVCVYDYKDRNSAIRHRVERWEPKSFKQCRPDDKGGWIYNLDGVGHLPYRLPEFLVELATNIFICEGEKDTDNVRALGLTASCISGSSKWTDEIAAIFRDRDIIILEHNDKPGRKKAIDAAKALHGVAKTVRIVPFTDIDKKGGDVSDWIELDPVNNNAEALVARGLQAPLFDPAAATADEPKKVLPGNVSPEDFYAYMPQHSYIFVPSGEMWPASSVNARLPPVQIVPGKFISASAHLDKTRAVEQMTWAPGEPKLIKDRLVEGGWIERVGCNTFNLYRPPVVASGDANKVAPWLEHVRRIYPDEADHIITWVAHRVQHPHDKINHALVLGGAQGIGKDTLLEPVKAAIGPWNFTETSPQQMLGRFNGFIQSVICRISEARDLGEINRYSFYEHMKAYTAAPPDTLRCDQKNLREYSVFNVLGVILTTNHKTGGIYLPDDDRRHFVAWSALAKEDFDATYFPDLWRWYRDGGIAHVVAYLRMLDLSGFNPKAPPPKTEAWKAIVDSNVAPETAELADVLDRLDNPDVVTLTQITLEAQDSEFVAWLKDRRNIRQIPHRFAEVGYEPVRNTGAGDGLWKVRGKRQAIYARRELSANERLRAIGRMR